MKSEDMARAIYNGNIYLRGLVWCAFIMRNWVAVRGEMDLFEKAIGEFVKARDAGRARGPIAIESHEIEVISTLRRLLSSRPVTAEDWMNVEAAARSCVTKLGFAEVLPMPPEGEDAFASEGENSNDEEAGQ